jgi:hypothetical protein
MFWITERCVIRELAAQIASSDSLMFGEPTFLHAFLENVRWDLRPEEVADYGLQRATLGLSTLETVALPGIGRLPDWIIRSRFCRGSFASKAAKLVRGSSGLWILTADKSSTHKTTLLLAD